MSTQPIAAALRPRERLDEPSITPGERVREVAFPLDRPALSVIVPVRNAPENLDRCLRSLTASEHSDFEVIVVDDASTDATPEVARRHGVRLIRLDDRSGPAAARNLGARAARYPLLFFLDSDVCVEPGTLGQVAAIFSHDPKVDAFFGSYDASPSAPGAVSQFRNLLHHYVHQGGNEDAFTFWSGCGAIKKTVFFKVGGFDIGFANASVEDIELGSRLRQAGHRITLIKSLQVKHLKRWTLLGMILTDVEKRGIPWTRLLLRQGRMPNDLNLKYGQRLSALCAVAFAVTLPAAPWTGYWSLLAPAFLLGIVGLNQRFYRFLARTKGPSFVLAALPLHVVYYLCGSLAFAIGSILHLGRGRRRRPMP